MSGEKASALTASGTKTIFVYGPELKLLGRIESWVSLVWPERYNTYKNVQGAQLELHESTSLQALCRPDRYLWLAGSEHLMRICSAQTSDHRLVVSARDAAYILDERSSLQTLKNFSAETTLRQLVTAMEPWPGVELGDLAEITDTYTGEAAPGSLLDVAEQVCQELDIGFRLRFDPAEKKLLFELYRPLLDRNARYAPQYGNLTDLTYTGEAAPGSLLDVAEQVCQELDIGFRLRFDPAEKKLLFELYRPLLDRNARYAPQYGNLTDLTYTESTADYKNVVIVVGGDATVTVGAESAAGIARRELVVDAASRTRSSSQTQSDYLESLKALGTQELAKHTRLENFRFTPTDEVTVGKVVAASLPGTDIQAAARITSITLTSQKGENSVSTEIGTPIIRRRT